MTVQERNKLCLRQLLAAVDAREIERALTFYAEDYVDHDASESRSGGGDALATLRSAFKSFDHAFTEVRHTIDDLVADGDRVAARISVEAHHVGEFFGIRATGRRVRNDSIVIYRFEEGRIKERWCRERRSTRALLEETASLETTP